MVEPCPRHQDEHGGGDELVLAHLAGAFRLDEARDEVVLGRAQAIGLQRAEIIRELRRGRFGERLAFRRAIDVEILNDVLRPAAQHRAIGVRHAEQMPDHVTGDMHGQIGDEIDLACAGEVRDQPADIGFDRGALPGDQRRREHAKDLPAQPVVHCAVAVEHRELYEPRMVRHVVEIVLPLAALQFVRVEDARRHARQAHIGHDGGDVALPRDEQHAELWKGI